MEPFKRKSFRKEHITSNDNGIYVRDLLALIINNKLYPDLYQLLEIEKIKDEFINIKGATTLCKLQASINQRFQKEDLDCDLSDITIDINSQEFSLNFDNIQQNIYFKNLGLETTTVMPIYSANRDFFAELYQMDKYASSLLKENRRDIVDLNYQILKDLCSPQKRYRLLYDTTTQTCYLRAIISRKQYYNYDNNIAVVVSLIAIHNATKRLQIGYQLFSCEYNESFIKIMYESNDIKQLKDIGYVKNIIEVTNDEIKREALRFSSVCSISFQARGEEEQELYVGNTQRVNTRIFTIKHNQTPSTAIEALGDPNKIKVAQETLFNDIQKIAHIQTPNEIRFLVRDKIEKSKTDEIKPLKNKLLSELERQADSIITLLSIFRKLELLAIEDIEASEYIRYIIYQALIERK